MVIVVVVVFSEVVVQRGHGMNIPDELIILDVEGSQQWPALQGIRNSSRERIEGQVDLAEVAVLTEVRDRPDQSIPRDPEGRQVLQGRPNTRRNSSTNEICVLWRPREESPDVFGAIRCHSIEIQHLQRGQRTNFLRDRISKALFK